MIEPDGTRATIERFFLKRTKSWPSGSEVSTLYLLRREIQDCLIGTVIEEDQVLTHALHRLFASAILIFTGIDLLGKFFVGDDRPGRSKKRFVDFVQRFSALVESPREERPLTPDEAVILYSFRNSLTHSFGMHHEDAGGARIPLVLFQSDQPDPVVWRRSTGTWDLSISDLYEMFVKSVWKYRDAVIADPDLQKKFVKMFDKYGWIYVRTLRNESGEEG